MFVRLLLLYHLLLIAKTPGRSELKILIKQELTFHLETRCLSPAGMGAPLTVSTVFLKLNFIFENKTFVVRNMDSKEFTFT